MALVAYFGEVHDYHVEEVDQTKLDFLIDSGTLRASLDYDVFVDSDALGSHLIDCLGEVRFYQRKNDLDTSAEIVDGFDLSDIILENGNVDLVARMREGKSVALIDGGPQYFSEGEELEGESPFYDGFLDDFLREIQREVDYILVVPWYSGDLKEFETLGLRETNLLYAHFDDVDEHIELVLWKKD